MRTINGSQTSPIELIELSCEGLQVSSSHIHAIFEDQHHQMTLIISPVKSNMLPSVAEVMYNGPSGHYIFRPQLGVIIDHIDQDNIEGHFTGLSSNQNLSKFTTAYITSGTFKLNPLLIPDPGGDPL